MRSRRQTLAVGLLAALIHNGAHAELNENGKALLEQGQYWQARKDKARASEAWRKLLLIDPQQADAIYNLGLLELDSNRADGAKRYLQQLQTAHPDSRQALLLDQEIRLHGEASGERLNQARVEVESGEGGKAVRTYRQLFDGKAPQGDLALEFYSTLGYTDGGWQEARQGLERLLRQDGDNPRVKLALAKLLLSNESTRADGLRRLASFRDDPAIGSQAVEAWRQGLSWLGGSKADMALFEDYLKAYPDDEEVREQMRSGQRQAQSTYKQNPHLQRGFKALEGEDLDAAEQSFQARLREAPQDADALGGLGLVRQRQGRLSDADALFRQAIKQGSASRWQAALQANRYWTLLDEAAAARDSGDPQQARSLLQRAIASNPREVQGHLNLADLQAAEGQFERAETTYRQALSLDPGQPDGLRGLVSVLAQSGKLGEAQRLMDNLSDAQRERLGDMARLRAAIAVGQAKDAERRGDLQGARAALEDAVRDDPRNPWTRSDLAELYVKTDAPNKARQTMDELLQANPNDADVLYAGALFASRQEQWQKAEQLLARIPASERSAPMRGLADEIELRLLASQASALAKQGKRSQALSLLQRAEGGVSGSPDLYAALAGAYIDIGYTDRAVGLLRNAIAQSSKPSAALRIAYGAALLKAGDDVQVSQILRETRGLPLSAGEQRSYDDLLFQYTVRQADLLREKGDLVAAYDTLAPALAQRPEDAQAVSSLARMYLDNRNPQKAVDLFEPLLATQADNADVQMGAAIAYQQNGQGDKAERAIERGLALAPENPDVLTTAAAWYKSRGKLGRAQELYAQALALQPAKETYVDNPFGQAVAANPFVGQPGQRKASRLNEMALSEIPEPARVQSKTRKAASQAPEAERFDEPVLLASNDAQAAPRRSAALEEPEPAVVNPDPRAAIEREMDSLREARSPQIKQGVTFRGNNGESGLSRITDVETPFEISFPVRDDRMALRVTPVSLNAGGLNANDSGYTRFGGFTQGLPIAADASVGSQMDSGVGLAVAYEMPSLGLKADLGSSPIGFQETNVVGGISLDRPFTENGNLRYNLNLSRRPVIDSLVSFAGARDARTDDEWGGVTANGLRSQLSYDNQRYGIYAYAGWARLLGNNVKTNDRAELGSGIYWYLFSNEDARLTGGLSLSAQHYDDNQSYFTYGHGGYFSPQNFFSIGLPFAWAQRGPNWSYQVQSSVGLQHIEQDEAPFFRDRAAQTALENLAASGAPVATRYEAQSKTGIGYSLGASGEYRLGEGFFFGGTVGVDNARDYRQFTGGLYLRYLFDDAGGAMPLPVSPYRSPYSN